MDRSAQGLILLALADLSLCCGGWGFRVQASTMPELLASAWFAVSFETKDECESVNAGMRLAGTYRIVEPCEAL